MKEKQLTISLPKSFVVAVSRRHYGRELSPEKVAQLTERMETLYKQYKKAKRSEEKLDEYWERENIEACFMSSKWYNAHSRLKRYRRAILENWRAMFYCLLEADGNSEPFSSYHCIDAEEIYEDFNRKYNSQPPHKA